MAKRTVEWEGRTYKVRSDKVDIPDLTKMSRIGALTWLCQQTYPRGHSTKRPTARRSRRSNHSWGARLMMAPTTDLAQHPSHVMRGLVVGATRIPRQSCHPDAWGRPWKGTVLAVDDPAAWHGTIAFPSATPDAAAVRKHVDWCLSQGLLTNSVPVIWEFGRVYFEPADSLRPYDDDVAQFNQLRAKAYAELAENRNFGNS